MAAPITHIVLTEKIFDNFFRDKKRKDFFVGTCFPDIRYLGVINRDATHISDLTISGLADDDAFSAGMKFHSLLDIARERYIVENDTYSLCPQSKHIMLSLKILEDEIFYDRVNDWPAIIGYFNDILPGQRQYGITEKDIRRWHTMLKTYISKPPDEKTVKDFMLNLGFSEDDALITNNNVAIMRNNKSIINILENMYKNFDTLIS